MDVREARAVLGVAEGDGWDVVRGSYRRLIRAAHPDLTGERAGTPGARQAARINEAYAVLSRARRAGAGGGGRPAPTATPTGDGARPRGGTGARPASTAAPPRAPAPPSAGVTVTGAETLLLAAPPDRAFALLVDAAYRLGSIGYVDRSCGVFEAVVRLEGEACSLLVMLEGRDHGTEASFALESLERAASYSPEPILRRIEAMLV